MSSFTDKDSNTDIKDGLSTASHVADPGRRRFSRSAIAGSAVLLSLGNRAAWGGGTVGCMSVATLNSFNPTEGRFVSAPAGRPDHNEDLAAKIHAVSSPPNYLGKSGDWSTCKEPGSIDGVCLVRGDCP